MTSNYRILSRIVPTQYVTRRILETPVPHQRTQPPWEFLLTASQNTLQSYELSRLGHAANLRKEIASLLDQYADENANAMIARVLIEQRERGARVVDPELQAADPRPAPRNGHSASHNFLVDRIVRPQASRNRG